VDYLLNEAQWRAFMEKAEANSLITSNYLFFQLRRGQASLRVAPIVVPQNWYHNSQPFFQKAPVVAGYVGDVGFPRRVNHF